MIKDKNRYKAVSVRLAKGTAAEITLRPFLVGGVFNAVSSSVYAGRADPTSPKMRMSWIWLEEWAALAGAAMNFPSPRHPLKSVLPMRACCVLGEDRKSLRRFSGAAFEAYFRDALNLDDPDILADIACSCGMDGPGLVKTAAGQGIKDRLRANTDEAIERGAFGSPTIFVDRAQLYFGNDQLPLVKARMDHLASTERRDPNG